MLAPPIRRSDAVFDFAQAVPFDRAREIAAPGYCTYKQNEPGPNPADIAQLRFEGFELAYERYGREVLVQGTRPADLMRFGIAESPAESPTLRGHALPPNALFYVAPPAQIDMRYRSCVSFAFKPAQLRARMAPADFETLMDTTYAVVQPEDAARLRALGHDALLAFKEEPRLASTPATCIALRDNVINVFASVLARNGDRRRLPRAAVRTGAAGRCEAYMLERLGRPITMRNLLEHTGVSERALRKGFVDRFGHGPKAHLTILRLNAARTALRHPEDDTAVAQTAMSHGFWHLGRFSGAYRDHFGELPSETLRQARAGARRAG